MDRIHRCIQDVLRRKSQQFRDLSNPLRPAFGVTLYIDKQKIRDQTVRTGYYESDAEFLAGELCEDAIRECEQRFPDAKDGFDLCFGHLFDMCIFGMDCLQVFAEVRVRDNPVIE